MIIEIMQNAFDDICQKTGECPKRIVCSHLTRREFLCITQNSPDTIDVRATRGLPNHWVIVVCPSGRVFGVDTDTGVAEEIDGEWTSLFEREVQ